MYTRPYPYQLQWNTSSFSHSKVNNPSLSLSPFISLSLSFFWYYFPTYFTQILNARLQTKRDSIKRSLSLHFSFSLVSVHLQHTTESRAFSQSWFKRFFTSIFSSLNFFVRWVLSMIILKPAILELMAVVRYDHIPIYISPSHIRIQSGLMKQKLKEYLGKGAHHCRYELKPDNSMCLSCQSKN